MLGWLRRRRRKEILEAPFPPEWEAIIESHLRHWRYLDEAERQRLRDLVQVFVAEKSWEGCGGLELDDEIRVTIAALACLLLLGHDHDLYRQVESILVYPSTVVAPPRHAPLTDTLELEEAPAPIVGEAMEGGPVLLVWDEVQHDTHHPQQGLNVVYHEFAHKLDMLAGGIDGTPPLATRAQRERWVEVCTREFQELRRRSDAGRATFLDAYGATDVGEFFAVVTERFFDTPVALQRRHPELYEVLQDFYLQDPAARELRGAGAD